MPCGEPVRVLILEDREDDALLAVRALRAGGYAPQWDRVANAEGLLAALDRQDWDAIIADYRMSGFTGLDALRLVQERGEDVPFIVVSGTISHETAVALMKTGATDYVMKDNLSRLPEALRRELRDAAVRRDKRRAAEALRVSELRFRRIFEAVPTGLMIVNEAAGTIDDANPMAARLAGLAREELIGRKARDFLCARPPGACPSTECSEAKPNGVSVYLAADGTEIPILKTVSSMQISDEENGYLIVGFVDARERLQAEQALREANQRQEEAVGQLRDAQKQVIDQERLRALAQMASGIAHEFNNQLMVIGGHCDLLLEYPDSYDSERSREMLQAIKTACQDATGIVQRMREFYRHRGETERVGPVRLESVADEVLRITEPKWRSQAQAAGREIRVERDFRDSPEVLAAGTDLREAVTNLVFNAVDAMPEGGTLTVRTRAQGPDAVLEVADTGVGMDETTRRQCLEPFFTTKGAAGTGLGLSVAYGVVERHGGSMEVRSDVGQGTTFQIRLPGRAAVMPKEDKGPQGTSAVHPLRILVVDDEAAVRTVLRGWLEREGHHVDEAADGREALQKLDPKAHEVIVADQAMPNMDGLGLVRALREQGWNRPVVLMSGFGAGEMPQPGQQGVDAVLAKPVEPQSLRTAIMQALAKWSAGGATNPT